MELRPQEKRFKLLDDDGKKDGYLVARWPETAEIIKYKSEQFEITRKGGLKNNVSEVRLKWAKRIITGAIDIEDRGRDITETENWIELLAKYRSNALMAIAAYMFEGEPVQEADNPEADNPEADTDPLVAA